MVKIVTVVGARPQFIKAAVVSRAFRENFPDVKEILVHTGQHYDVNMSDVFFDEMDIPHPHKNLNIGGGSHGQNTGRMIEAVEKVLLEEKPDWVLVYGDTDSTLAGTLAAAKLHIPVAHVEAGLRSFNRRMPEEINRVLTDHASRLLFAPTSRAIENLEKEGISGGKVVNVGDVMYDAALFYAKIAQEKSRVLESLGLTHGGYALATIHRAENTDDSKRLAGILKGLSASVFPVIWPMHPRTKARLRDFGLDVPDSVRVMDPVGYLDMVQLEKAARLVTTDSGGVQKEAYFHRVPCITLRDETEWVELVDAGANVLVGADSAAISRYMAEPPEFPEQAGSLYGSGNAGVRIAGILSRGVS